jgi:uncharacterized protein
MMQVVNDHPLALEEYYSLLTQAEVSASPSAIHGTLCGFICSGRNLNGGAWLNSLLARLSTYSQISIKHKTALLNLYQEACYQLMGNHKSFDLLLPSKEYTLANRAVALGAWCQGFLSGLQMSMEAYPQASDLSDDVFESLYCIVGIAKLDFKRIEMTFENQPAYEEMRLFLAHAIPRIYQVFNQSVKSCSQTIQ